MDSSRRYRLSVFLRFSDLQSELGEGPKKITLQRLRKVRSWPSCGPDEEIVVKEDGDALVEPDSTEEVPIVREQAVELDPPERRIVQDSDGIRIIPGPDLPDAENGSPGPSHRRQVDYSFPREPRLPVQYDSVMSRREKRALREREYISRTRRGLRQSLFNEESILRNVNRTHFGANAEGERLYSSVIRSRMGSVNHMRDMLRELDQDEERLDATIPPPAPANRYPPPFQDGTVLTTEQRQAREASRGFDSDVIMRPVTEVGQGDNGLHPSPRPRFPTFPGGVSTPKRVHLIDCDIRADHKGPCRLVNRRGGSRGYRR